MTNDQVLIHELRVTFMHLGTRNVPDLEGGVYSMSYWRTKDEVYSFTDQNEMIAFREYLIDNLDVKDEDITQRSCLTHTMTTAMSQAAMTLQHMKWED